MNGKPDSFRMTRVLRYLYKSGETGATWGEIGSELGLHHGKVSSILSTLHKEGRISRLKQKRGNSYIYVDNQFVGDREVGQYGRIRKDNDFFDGYKEGTADARGAAMMVLQSVRQPIQPHNKQCWRDHPACAIKVVVRQFENLGPK
jgi:hypothetical protein